MISSPFVTTFGSREQAFPALSWGSPGTGGRCHTFYKHSEKPVHIAFSATECNASAPQHGKTTSEMYHPCRELYAAISYTLVQVSAMSVKKGPF